MSSVTLIAIALVSPVALVIGCGDDTHEPPPGPAPAPADFHVDATFASAPVTPVYQYDYAIALDATAADTVRFDVGGALADQGHGWIEPFDTSPADLEVLYNLMLDQKVFRASWELEVDPPVGTPSRSMTVTAGGARHTVPAGVAGRAAVDPVYAGIESCVPSAIWDSLWARRQRYIDDHGGL